MAAKNVKSFELKLRKTGVIALVAGMALLSCGAFIIGVEMGKNLDAYPEKISSLPKKLFAIVSKPAKIEPLQNAVGDEQDISEVKEAREIESADAIKSIIDKDDRKQQKPAEKNDELKGNERPASPKLDNKNETQGALSAAAKTNGAAPVSGKKEEKYIIHAASYQQKEKAYLLNKKIAGMGYDPKIIPVQIKNKGTWYRVVISGFESKEKANLAAQKIANMTGADCLVRAAGISKK